MLDLSCKVNAMFVSHASATGSLLPARQSSFFGLQIAPPRARDRQLGHRADRERLQPDSFVRILKSIYAYRTNVRGASLFFGVRIVFRGFLQEIWL